MKFGKSSFLRKQESSLFKTFWIPAYAGMTKWGYFSKLSYGGYGPGLYFTVESPDIARFAGQLQEEWMDSVHTFLRQTANEDLELWHKQPVQDRVY